MIGLGPIVVGLSRPFLYPKKSKRSVSSKFDMTVYFHLSGVVQSALFSFSDSLSPDLLLKKLS